MDRRLIYRLIPVLIAIVVIGFRTCSAEKFTNEAGRTAVLALSPEKEAQLGLQSYRQVLQSSPVVDSGQQLEMVKRCATRLARAAAKSGHKLEWQVALIDQPDVNAFCLPGGKIAVFTGILPVAQSETGLAVVMGHEMAHATLRHGSERLMKEEQAQTLLAGVSFSLGDMDLTQRRMVMGALGAGARYGYLNPFSRSHESEADAVGLRYMARAGYDPREAIQFWKRMAAVGGGKPPEFLSTHPSDSTRVERLRKLVPEVLAEYEANRTR
jgi:predicted Zn-dependent protease